MNNRNNERCIKCHQKLVQGSLAAWCPESHKFNSNHSYSVEHDGNDNIIGERLVSGSELYLSRKTGAQ